MKLAIPDEYTTAGMVLRICFAVFVVYPTVFFAAFVLPLITLHMGVAHQKAVAQEQQIAAVPECPAPAGLRLGKADE